MCPTTMLGFLFTDIYILIIITMFKDEITIDDVIEFIIKNCDDREAMDKISRTSFPFTTKYLENDKPQKKYYFNKTRKDTDYVPNQYPYITTLCSSETEKQD